MIICLRRDIAWLEVRMNRRRQVRSQTYFGRRFQTLEAFVENGYDFVIRDIWAGPLVIRLEHWRMRDA